MTKRYYSGSNARTGARIELRGGDTPGIVADVGEDQRDDRGGGEAGETERPAGGHVAQPVDPQVDARQPDQRGQQDPGGDPQAAPRDPGEAPERNGHGEPDVERRIRGMSAREGRAGGGREGVGRPGPV